MPVSRSERVRAYVAVYSAIRKQRASAHSRALLQLERSLLSGQHDAIAAFLAMSQDLGGARRTIQRAAGKWRGSTLAGYLHLGDDKTYIENFRCSKHRFIDLVKRLKGSCLDKAEERTEHRLRGRAARFQKANAVRDTPGLRFKVAACMYALGQGGPLKVLADAGSLGKSTLKKYLGLFADAVTTRMKPIFMPGKPFADSEREAVRAQFASRRGIKNVVLACDGSHIPFHPKNKRVAMDYRNYKGWYSILAVGFVDSYYRFFGVHVGYPGRAGDNTILARWKLMEDISRDRTMWLGPGGVVLGDSGASDGDQVFLNPYFNPSDPDKNYFNFCHSSTRFFVEQVFGIWKSRFRFLLCPIAGADHKLTTKLIYASCILHNYLIVHSMDKVEIDTGERCWTKFFNTFKKMSCPECTAARVAHCPHQAAFRVGHATAASILKRPSEARDGECVRLWAEVCGGTEEGAANVRRLMEHRAVHGVQR